MLSLELSLLRFLNIRLNPSDSVLKLCSLPNLIMIFEKFILSYERFYELFSYDFKDYDNLTTALIKLVKISNKISQKIDYQLDFAEKTIKIIAKTLIHLIKKGSESLFHIDKTILKLKSELEEDLVMDILKKGVVIVNDPTFFNENMTISSKYIIKIIQKVIILSKSCELFWAIDTLINILSNLTFEEKPSKKSILNVFAKKENRTKAVFEDMHYLLKSVVIIWLKTLIEERKSLESKDLYDCLLYLKEKCFVIFDSRFEKDDFICSLIYFMWLLIFSSEKDIRNICIDILSFFIQISRNSFKRILKTYDCNAYEKGFDFLLQIPSKLNPNLKSTPEEFFTFLNNYEVKGRIEKMVFTVLKPENIAFISNVKKTALELSENPLFFSNELNFYENIASAENVRKENMKRKSNLNFSKAIDLTLIKEVFSKDESFRLSASERLSQNKIIADFLITLEREGKNYYFRANDRKKEIMIKNKDYQKNLKRFKKSCIFDLLESEGQKKVFFKEFAFSLGKRTGFNLTRSLIYLKKASDLVLKERNFSKTEHLLVEEKGFHFLENGLKGQIKLDIEKEETISI